MSIVIIDKFSGGLNASSVTSQVQQDMTDCEDALNVEFYPRGTVSQRDGYKAAAVTATNSGMTYLYKWTLGAVNYALGFTCSGAGGSATMMTLDLAGGTYSIKLSGGAGGWNPEYNDAISVTSYCNSAIATYKDCIGAPIIFDGTNAVAQTTMPSGCRCIQGFGNYLFVANHLVGGVRKGSRVTWNSAADISTWPSGTFIDLDPDDGDQITCMRIVGEYLVVFKNKKIFIVYWVGGTLQFTSARRSVTVGCVGPNAALELSGKIIFLASDGAYSFDGTATQELSVKIRPLFQGLNPTYTNICEAFEYLDKKQVWFCVPYNASATTTTTRNYIFVWDYELNNWTKFNIACSSISYFVDTAQITYGDLNTTYGAETRTFGSYATYGDEKVYIGFLTGKVHQFGKGTTKDDDTAIASMWKSVWLAPGNDGNPNPITNKRLTRITLLITRKATGNLLVDLQEDWKNEAVADSYQSWSGTQSATMTGVTTAELLEKRLDATRYARAFQVVASGDSSGNPWTLHRIMIDITERGRTFV